MSSGSTWSTGSYGQVSVGTISKLFTSPAASTVPTVLSDSTTTSTSVINGIGQAVLNHSMDRAILAAKQGNDRVTRATAKAQGHATTMPVGSPSTQVTYVGALAANFGASGPPQGGGYSFVSGAALKSAFKVAFGAKMSNGAAIDNVAVVGNTLTGGTSGANAKRVFTLTLHPDSGLYTFQLLAPIDQSGKKGSSNTIYPGGLMQAVNAAGQQVQLPNIKIDIYNDSGNAYNGKNWGILHEAALTYVDPSQAATTSSSTSTTSAGSGTSSKTSKSSSYSAPTDSRTLYGYTSNLSAARALTNTVNIFS